MDHLSKALRQRRSVRTFLKKPVDPSLLESLQAYAAENQNPFGIEVRFVFLDAKEHHLSAPVLSNEPFYIAAVVNKVPYGEEAVGYAFEKLMLKAVSEGLGTVWIGGTMKREMFEKAAGIKEGERMPCITPVGYPAKPALKEAMMRKGVGADQRRSRDQLFFEGSFTVPLAEQDPVINEALEAVRWAPSAVNKQPWRIVRKDGRFHFYKYSEKSYYSEPVGDMQRIDAGIALCHFMTVLEENGRTAEVVIEDPKIAEDPDLTYIVSVKTEREKEYE
ncbi:MAG: nitroreductase family protein [Solobacterium sp.]|nr:nitroreductase family protein [Solobacterium sp.]